MRQSARLVGEAIMKIALTSWNCQSIIASWAQYVTAWAVILLARWQAGLSVMPSTRNPMTSAMQRWVLRWSWLALKVTIAHVGDSRCYLQRQGEGLLYQTEDHLRIDFGWEIVSRCFFTYRPEVAVPDIKQFTIRKEIIISDRVQGC